MKIKGIANICRKSRQVILYDHDRGETVTQWIGTYAAMYLAEGLPYLDRDNIMAIFDVPEKQREEWHCESEEVPKRININDGDPNENPVEIGKIPIIYNGATLLPIQTRHGMIFINSRYTAPLSDAEELGLYERITPDGQPYIVIKDGLLIQAVVMPAEIISEEFLQDLREIYNQCTIAFSNKKSVERGGLRIDPETGEVFDDTAELDE